MKTFFWVFLLHHCPTRLIATVLNFFRSSYVADNAKMYLHATNLLKMNHMDPNIFEFGVGSGGTSSILYWLNKRENQKEPKLFLFDTFEGLPEAEGIDKHPQWKKGAWSFSTQDVKNFYGSIKIPENSYQFVKGLYSESLTKDLQLKLSSHKAGIIHIDCDYYESTIQALEFMYPMIQEGTVILCDDYYCFNGSLEKGEAAALTEFSAKYQVQLNRWHVYSNHGQAFIISKLGKK